MLISLFDQDNRLLGSLKINLYLLATGPYHQDFAIPLSKADNARISFNLKIAQEVGLKLQVEEAEMIPNDKELFPADIFAFGLSSIVSDCAPRWETDWIRANCPISTWSPSKREK